MEWSKIMTMRHFFYSANIQKTTGASTTIDCGLRLKSLFLKKWFPAIVILFIALYPLNGFGQAYLGWITKQANLRSGPGTEFRKLASLRAGKQIFIVSAEPENDFINIIDIATNREGYVSRSFVKFGKEVEKNEGGLFTPAGESSSDNPEIEIYNNTSRTLTLKLNTETYSFSPYKRRTLTLSSGSYDYRASAPGVIPDIGVESMEGNSRYTWEFYIVTRRR
jgi:hypothetical protein